MQDVNIKLVKKGRKYWSCIQHWKGRGGIERDYEVKMLIDDSNKNLEAGTELANYHVEVQKEESRYGTKMALSVFLSRLTTRNTKMSAQKASIRLSRTNGPMITLFRLLVTLNTLKIKEKSSKSSTLLSTMPKSTSLFVWLLSDVTSSSFVNSLLATCTLTKSALLTCTI